MRTSRARNFSSGEDHPVDGSCYWYIDIWTYVDARRPGKGRSDGAMVDTLGGR